MAGKGLFRTLMIFFLIIITSILIFPFACIKPEVPQTIKIGTLYDVTGPLLSFGIECRYGFDRALEDVNKDGGVYIKEYDKKIPVELLIGDHSADEMKAVTEAENLIEKGSVAIIGTTATLPYGAIFCEKKRTPLLVFSSLVQVFEQGFKYIFSSQAMDDDMSKWPFELINIFPDPKPVKIGMMEEQNVMGMDYSTWFQKEAGSRGFSNYIIEKYQRFSGDFASAVLKLKDSGVDFVYAPMLGPDGKSFWKQMKQLDYNPKAILMLIAPGTRKDWQNLGKDGNYVLTHSAYHWSFPYPGVKEFSAVYEADHNGEKPTELAGWSYSAIQVMADAIKRAGTLNKARIRDALAATDIMTIIGPVKFRPNGMSNVKPACIQYIDGQETIIWPSDLAQRAPVYPFPNWKDPNR